MIQIWPEPKYPKLTQSVQIGFGFELTYGDIFATHARYSDSWTISLQNFAFLIEVPSFYDYSCSRLQDNPI